MFATFVYTAVMSDDITFTVTFLNVFVGSERLQTRISAVVAVPTLALSSVKEYSPEVEPLIFAGETVSQAGRFENVLPPLLVAVTFTQEVPVGDLYSVSTPPEAFSV